MQFQEIIRIYSLDVILIAGLVCVITALLRKYCRAFYERAGQYLPFVLAVALYLLYDMAVHHFDALEQAISKGLQCAVCAVLLKTAFEEWICKEKKVSLPKDRTLFAAMGVLSTVTRSLPPDLLRPSSRFGSKDWRPSLASCACWRWKRCFPPFPTRS